MSDSHPGGEGFAAPEPVDPAPTADPRDGLTDWRPEFVTSASAEPLGPDFAADDDVAGVVAVGGRRRRRWTLIAAGVAAVVLLTAGSAGAYVAYSRLAAHGDQPEKALPSSTVAMVKIDFDPAASAKLNLYHLAQKFPGLVGTVTRGNAGQSLKDELVSELLKEGDAGRIDYATDVKPWLGNRAALAAVPDGAAPDGVVPVLAIEVRDRAKMTAALTKIKADLPAFGYAVRGDYALIAASQAAADHVAALDNKGSLQSNPTFAHDLHSLPGHQLAVAWVDEAAVQHSVRSATTPDNPFTGLTHKLTSRLVLGLHTTSTYAEISGASYGTTGHPASSHPVDTTLANLPAGTDVAVSVAGLGPALTDEWTTLAGTAQIAPELRQIRDAAAQVGLDLPADINNLLGTVDTVAVTIDPRHAGGDPQVGVLVTTGAATQAVAFLSKSFAHLPLNVTRTGHGYAVATTASFATTLTATTGPKLGASPQFAHAVPDAASATAVGFVNLNHLIQTDPTVSAKDRANLAHLSALGFAMHPTANGATFTVRLTTQ